MRKLRDKVAHFATGSVLLTVAVVFGVATALLTLSWLNANSAAEDDASAPSVVVGIEAESFVVVARVDIAAGERVTAAMVELASVAEGDVLDGALSASSDAEGRVARYPIVAGEQLLERKLVDDVSGDGLAFSIPPGMRAVSVRLSEIMGAGGLVVPGDRVDVMVATTYARLFGPYEVVTPEGAASHPTVMMVLQNMLVLAIGQQFTPIADEGRDPATLRPEDAEAQPGAASVTLAVTPRESLVLFMAAQQGTLGLALRAFGDESENTFAPEFKLEASIGSFDGLATAR